MSYKYEYKMWVKDFIDKNVHLLTVLGIFITIATFFTSYTNEVQRMLAFVFFIISWLLFWTLFLQFPKMQESGDWLRLLRGLLFIGWVMLYWYLLMNYNDLFGWLISTLVIIAIIYIIVYLLKLRIWKKEWAKKVISYHIFQDTVLKLFLELLLCFLVFRILKQPLTWLGKNIESFHNAFMPKIEKTDLLEIDAKK